MIPEASNAYDFDTEEVVDRADVQIKDSGGGTTGLVITVASPVHPDRKPSRRATGSSPAQPKKTSNPKPSAWPWPPWAGRASPPPSAARPRAPCTPTRAACTSAPRSRPRWMTWSFLRGPAHRADRPRGAPGATAAQASRWQATARPLAGRRSGGERAAPAAGRAAAAVSPWDVDTLAAMDRGALHAAALLREPTPARRADA